MGTKRLRGLSRLLVNYVRLDGRFFSEQGLAPGLQQDKKKDLACIVSPAFPAGAPGPRPSIWALRGPG